VTHPANVTDIHASHWNFCILMVIAEGFRGTQENFNMQSVIHYVHL